MEGWIKLHRKLLTHWIWSNDKYLKAWIYCLFRANFTEQKVLTGANLIDLKKGEFITSINHFARDTGMSEQSVRTFWRLLENDNMINRVITHKSTKITVCKYDTYQVGQQPNNIETALKQHDANTMLTTDKKEKKVKNENKRIFNEFWDHYHSVTKTLKTDKEAAQSYWMKLSSDEMKKAHDSVKPYFDSLSEKKYCKKARTYLGDKNFNDEFSIAPKADPKYNFDYSTMNNPDWDAR